MDSALLSLRKLFYILLLLHYFFRAKKKSNICSSQKKKKSVFTPNTDLSFVYSCLLHAEVLFCEAHQVTIFGHFFARAWTFDAVLVCLHVYIYRFIELYMYIHAAAAQTATSLYI